MEEKIETAKFTGKGDRSMVRARESLSSFMNAFSVSLLT